MARTVRIVLIEATSVAIAALLFGLGANAISPRGLRLTRNYFPSMGKDQLSGKATPTKQSATSTVSKPSTNIPPANPLEATLQRLKQHGLQTISSNEVAALFTSPSYEQGLALLVDARDTAHYEKAHIPGAWQFDHYHAEQYLPTILPVCMTAQQVVVYCAGGACEDSEFAAVVLRDAGVPGEKIFVYAGGMTEWNASGRAVESGVRRSGLLVKPKSE